MKKTRKPGFNKGFTIIELMIALSVLSTLLIMSTVILMQIGSLYTKGVNQANLQNSGRNVVADITAALQFSGNAPVSCTDGTYSCDAGQLTGKFSSSGSGIVIGAFCVGTVRYSYVLNSEQGTDSVANPITGAAAGYSIPHVLWRDTIAQNATCQPLDLSRTTVLADGSSADASSGSPSGGYDMLLNHMRLTRFKIEPTGSTGDIYSVQVWTAYGDSDLVNTTTTAGPTAGQSTCNGGPGTQFCSVSQISSTVAGRTY